MAHPQQQEFCRSVKDKFPQFFSNVRVCDIGSYDVNGNNRSLFSPSFTYIGVDVAAGPNVDVISPGHLYVPEEVFDVVISTETFEHDLHFPLTLKHIAHSLLRPGGLFLFTCATEGRSEHGTARSNPQDCPALQRFDDWKNYYRNITEADVRTAIAVADIFSPYAFSTHPSTKDLYFYGIKKKDDGEPEWVI